MLVKDPYNHHGEKVANISQRLAIKLQLFNEEELTRIYWAARLHDIGKVYLEDALMNLPRRLTTVERSHIQAHTTLGASLLSHLNVELPIVRCAEQHHEDWGGTGYMKLKGEAISRCARIIRIVDTYDAMTSQRAYRGPIPKVDVLAHIKKSSGTLFDPAYAAVFIDMMEGEKKNGDK